MTVSGVCLCEYCLPKQISPFVHAPMLRVQNGIIIGPHTFLIVSTVDEFLFCFFKHEKPLKYCIKLLKHSPVFISLYT